MCILTTCLTLADPVVAAEAACSCVRTGAIVALIAASIGGTLAVVVLSILNVGGRP